MSVETLCPVFVQINVNMVGSVRINTTFRHIHVTNDFMKICSVAAELFHEDGQTDMKKLIFAFRNFVNMLNNLSQKVSFEINEEMK